MDGVDDAGIMRAEENMQGTSATGMNLVTTATAANEVARHVDRVKSILLINMINKV